MSLTKYVCISLILVLPGYALAGTDDSLVVAAQKADLVYSIFSDAPLAEGQSKFLGCAHSTSQSTNFVKYWNQVTPENGGKWGSVEYTRDVMNWTAMDAAYNLAKGNGFLFKSHTMIWGSQQPSWIESLDSAEQRQEIEEWFQEMADRYSDIDFIDVVNEPLHAPPSGTGKGNYIKALGGSGTTGWDWVLESFRLARKYFPNAKLLINEYNIVNSTTNTEDYIEIIDLLKADTLIDGIGVQAHAFSTKSASVTVMNANLDLLAATELPVYVSELDIDGPTDLEQLREYQRVFPVFWEHPAVEGITLWGFRYGLWRTDYGAYLVTAGGVERPAFTWLKAYVNDTLTLTQSIEVTCGDDNDTLFIDETAQMTATVLPYNTTIPTVAWTTSPSGIVSISDDGLITPITTGKVTVKAIAWDGSGKIGTRVIQIVNRLIESIHVSALTDKDTITLDETLQLQATVLPENATNPAYIWSVIPEAFAQISEDGLLTPLSVGTVTVIATAVDGSKVADSIDITIENVPTGVQSNLETGEIKVYPNPSIDGRFVIEGLESISGIQIMDLTGKTIRQCRLSGQARLEVQSVSVPGIYIIRLQEGQRAVYKRIVVE